MQSPQTTARTGIAPAAHWLAMAGFFAVAGYFLWFLHQGAVNIPHQDGIYDFIQFVINVETADSFSAAFAEWFAHYNDHRTNASRLQVYVAYLIQGEMNFHTLTILANLSLLLVLAAFFLVVREHPLRWFVVLASAGLLLHPRVYTIVLWSQPVFAYCYVFAFAFATLLALHRVTPASLVLAALLCTLASWSFAAAQALWAFGLASLLHQCLFNERRSWRYVAVWIGFAVAMLLLWRVGHNPIEMTQFDDLDPALLASVFPGALIDPTWQEAAVRFGSFFLVMLGSAFHATDTVIAGWIGAVMLALLAAVTLVSFQRPDVRLLLCTWYVVASAAAVTYGRALVAFPDYSLTSRYSFLSVLFASVLAALLLSRLQANRLGVAAIAAALSLVYCAWAYQHFAEPLDTVMQKRLAAFNKGHFPVFGYPMKDSNAVVQQAIDLGIYQPPCRPQPACED